MGLVLLVNETSQNWIFFYDLSFMKPKKNFLWWFYFRGLCPSARDGRKKETRQNRIFFCDLSFLMPKRIFCGGSISVISARACGMDGEVKPLRIGSYFCDLSIRC